MKYLIDANDNYYEAEVNLTGATEVAKRPDEWHTYVSGAWVIAPAESSQRLSALRKAKRQELKAARDAAMAADVTIGARTWPTDDAFKLKLAAIIARVSRGKSPPAKLRGTSGNAINTPTLAQLDAIDDAINAQEDAATDRYWLRIDELQAATTPEQVAAVVW